MGIGRLVQGTALSILVLSANQVLAGGWIGGGGELVKDAHNPWFIQNTTRVTYCVAQDLDHFHLDSQKAKARIVDAINYWKNEFAHAYTMTDERSVVVANQSFDEVSCAQSGVDIVFQLGMLSPDQLQQIEDPTDYVSMAVRTDYDRVNLRGRGFIYVAPDSGPFRPDSERMIDRPWELNDGGLLLHVLAHELGHVFGIQHSDDQPGETGTGMMSAAYPEYILDRNWAQNIAQAPLPNYFRFDQRPFNVRTLCVQSTQSLPQTLIDLWGMPAGSNCWKMDYANGSVKVYAGGTGRIEDVTPIGSIALHQTLDERVRFGISVWLPRQQTVLPVSSDPSDYYAYGPMVSRTGASGNYATTDGRVQRYVHLQFPLNESQWPQMFADYNGNIVQMD